MGEDGTPVLLATFLQGFGEPLWFDVNGVVALLETVGRHLENRQAGSRFPLVWRLGTTLNTGTPEAWSRDELPAVLAEVDSLERECEALPATLSPTIYFGEEGFADIFSRESPRATGTVRSRFQHVLDGIRQAVTSAQQRGQDLRLEQRGTPIHWWK